MNLKRLSVLVIGAALVAGIVFFLSQEWQDNAPSSEASLPVDCEIVTFDADEFIVCTVDMASRPIEFHLNDETGKPWRSLDRFAASMRGENRPLLFAMNAGMYHEDLSPVGLFIANQKRIAPLQIGSGEGNFYLKPNGIFGIYSGGQAFVTSSDTYFASSRVVEFATQSGPMLVINGALHPRFEPDGESRFIRNGVGVNKEGRAVFAISREPVSFGKFARLFRDQLHCQNALYFDGVVSALYGSDSMIQGGGYPVGPIVAVFEQTVRTQ